MTVEYETILVETRGRVGLITLNRPKALNALNATVMHDVLAAARALDADDGIAVIVLTGSERAFAAGADIKAMAASGYADVQRDNVFADWELLTNIRKPLIAAVAGYALGGGCELAMLCDIVVAADTAQFGQPEINLGVIPGMGGSQRLTRAIGKSKAMEMVLTGRTMDAAEAERTGLVARVFPAATMLDDALELAETIAQKSLPVIMVERPDLPEHAGAGGRVGSASGGEGAGSLFCAWGQDDLHGADDGGSRERSRRR